MKSKEARLDRDEEKKKLWKDIELVYRKSVDSISSLLKKNETYHFYEEKDGWDDSAQPISGHVNEEMTPEEIIVWMYENEVNLRSIKSPYIYTDDEIDFYRKNRDLVKIEDWKNSIEFCREQIQKYEKRISDAMKKVHKRSRG